MDKLKNLVWLCTRAYDAKFAYSLGDGRAHANELKTDEAKTLVRKAADFGVEHFFITGGGEPLIRKDILEILRLASDHEIALYLKTDGFKIDESMARKLASCDCKMIISIAGPREVDEQLRGQGAFERSIAAARLCAKEDILFSLSVVNTRYIVDRIRDLVDLAQDLGARSFSLASLIPQPICVNEQLSRLAPLEASPLEHEKELNTIYELSKEKDINILAYDIFYNRILAIKEPSLKLRSRCSLCHNLESNEWLDILDDGIAYGCSPLGLAFGDIRRDSIEEIMNKIRSSEVVIRLADRSNLKEKCGICRFNGICGGCRAKAYIYSGDMYGPDPLCSYVESEV